MKKATHILLYILAAFLAVFIGYKIIVFAILIFSAIGSEHGIN